MRPVIPDNRVKFGDPLVKTFLRKFHLKPSEAAFSTVFLLWLPTVSDVISGVVDQDVGVDVCANFRDSYLKLSEASFSVVFPTSITSDQKYIVTSYQV